MNVNPFYENFSRHPFIQSIANTEKWTISTNTKMPIDMCELMYNHRILGAIHKDELSLVTLPTLNSVMPNAANYAFYLNSPVDGFVVLDIEPKCPEEIKQKLLAMDGARYIEKSMSGKGYHMVFDYPYDIMDKYPNAQDKIVFKEPDGGIYEILIEHYVTFTGNIVTPQVNPNVERMSFAQLFEELASNQKPTNRGQDVDFDGLVQVETGQIERVYQLLRNAADSWRKTPEDFKDKYNKVDWSTYEFAYTGYLYNKLEIILKVSAIKDEHTYTDDEKVSILYNITKDVIPFRKKHEEHRNGYPWLVYLIISIMSTYQKNVKDNNPKGGDA